MTKKFEVWEQEPTKETTTSIADNFNQSNCITVQKNKIKDLEKENLQLHEDLDYYKAKSGSCEEGLFQKDREIAKLEKENKQLEKTISHYVDISALSVEILNEEEEVINDYARIVCNDAEELIKENEQLKKFKDNVFDLIEEKINEAEKGIEETINGEKDSYIVKHDIAIKLLKELRKELKL